MDAKHELYLFLGPRWQLPNTEAISLFAVAGLGVARVVVLDGFLVIHQFASDGLVLSDREVQLVSEIVIPLVSKICDHLGCCWDDRSPEMSKVHNSEIRLFLFWTNTRHTEKHIRRHSTDFPSPYLLSSFSSCS